jgi:[ribosomal protein S18]-alanine N-acetyltransferase
LVREATQRSLLRRSDLFWLWMTGYLANKWKLTTPVPALIIVMQTIFIREYQPSDKESCLEIFNSNVPRFFASEELKDFEAWLHDQATINAASANPRSDYYYVVEKEKRLIACGGFYMYPNEFRAIMVWGMVESAFHKQGIGRQFLEYRMKQIRLLKPGAVIILDTTQHAYPFFEKLGFRVTQVTKDYYAQGMDRYDMVSQ